MAYTTIPSISFTVIPDPVNSGQLTTTTLSYESQIDLAEIIAISEYFTPGTSGVLPAYTTVILPNYMIIADISYTTFKTMI